MHSWSLSVAPCCSPGIQQRRSPSNGPKPHATDHTAATNRLHHAVVQQLPSLLQWLASLLTAVIVHHTFLQGNLYIANSPLGLLQLVKPGDKDEQKLLLATGRVSDESPLLAGYPVEFANSLDIASDGTVYLSSSTDVLAYK